MPQSLDEGKMSLNTCVSPFRLLVLKVELVGRGDFKFSGELFRFLLLDEDPDHNLFRENFWGIEASLSSVSRHYLQIKGIIYGKGCNNLIATDEIIL